MNFGPETLADIETKLSAARTRLILEKPFLGALVMHLPMVAREAEQCRTTATDARAFYFNPDYIQTLTLSQTQFILAHEALHCALGHFARRRHRVRRRWDVACDHAVNLMLVEEGLKPAPGALLEKSFKGLSAEEIYPLIPDDTIEETLDQHSYDEDGDDQNQNQDNTEDEGESSDSGDANDEQSGPAPSAGESADDQESAGAGAGAGEPSDQQPDQGKTSQQQPLSDSERDELETLWRQRLVAAAQQARQAGRLGESLARSIDDLVQPKLPWRALLSRYMMSAARDDYSFQRISRREGAAMMPSLHSGQMDVVIALDTSGSIEAQEIAEFIAEVDALKGQLRARVTLLACDETITAGPLTYETWEPIEPVTELGGGAGTRFTPIFEWIEHENVRPNLVLYFTDAEGEFPSHEPPYPVLWLVKGNQPVPWGQRIQLN